MTLDEKKLQLLRVIESHEKELQAFAAQKVRSSQLAACGAPVDSQAREIYSDLWLTVNTKNVARRYDPEKGTPIAWLKGIIRNLVRGRLRDLNRRNKRRACPDRSVSETGAMDLAAGTSMFDEDNSEDGVLSERYTAEPHLDIESAAEFLLRRAGDRYAWPLRLRYLEGFSSEEVGRLLGLTANALDQQVHRAKAYLRKRTSLDAAFDVAFHEGPTLAQMDWTSVRR